MDGCEKVKKAKMVFISFQDFQVEQSEKPEPTIPHYSIAFSISMSISISISISISFRCFVCFIISFILFPLTRLVLFICVSVFQSYCRVICLFRYLLTVSLRPSFYIIITFLFSFFVLLAHVDTHFSHA